MEADKTYQILVVDDSDYSRSIITSMLENTPYKVVGEAGNAKEAIDILKESSADVCIIDIVMPEVSGIELTDKLKSMFKHMVVINISSLAQESIVMDAIGAGASDFLQKPFDKDTLISSLSKVVSEIS